MSSELLKVRDPRREFRIAATDASTGERWGSVFSLSNGFLGLRGSPEDAGCFGRPGFYVAGTYAAAPKELLGLHDSDHILVHPERLEAARRLTGQCLWTLPNLPFPIAVRLGVGGEILGPDISRILADERTVEFETAVLRATMVIRDSRGRRTRVESRRFVSIADRNLACLHYTATPMGHGAPVDACGYIEKEAANANGLVLWSETRSIEEAGLAAVECAISGTETRVAIAQRGVKRKEGQSVIVELFAIAGEMPLDEAVRRADRAADKGFKRNLDEHCSVYTVQRGGATVEFDGDIPTQQGFNFGQMQLHMAFPYGDKRVGLPIKGLTGEGYRFATFWDTDAHMFPYYLLTKPREARVILEYRYNQLQAYRENARLWGAQGAQVPWETQLNGREATAPWLCLQDREIHISADAAYMFKMYDELSGDHSAMVEMGAEFILETARFYASRVRWAQGRGRWEIPGVACPDQYHTLVDNDFYTNLMARWNIEYAIVIAECGEYESAVGKAALAGEEVQRWKDIAAKIYVAAPNGEGIIGEFDGYLGLSNDIEGISERHCAHSQAVKQPDVLAAFIPFEHLYSPEIRRRNWLFYADRTMHGSSLSHPGMAYAAARAGLNDEALYQLGKSARLDLDDLNLDEANGVHVSGAAVAWRAVVCGFGGLSAGREYLHFEPNLPRQWGHLRFAVYWRLQRVTVNLEGGGFEFEADTANTLDVAIKVETGEVFELAPGGRRSVRLSTKGSAFGGEGARYDIAFLGHMCYDEITPFEGETAESPGSAVFCGALTAARIGRRVAAIVKMAPADEKIVEPMREAGVDVYVIPAAETTHSRVIHDVPDVDSRRLLITRDAGRISLDEVPEIDAVNLHLAGISDREFDVALMEGLARRGYRLSVDMQSFVRQVNVETGEVAFGDVPEKERIARLADKIKLDALEAKILTGTDDLEEAAGVFEGYGCREVVITRSDGILARAYGRTFFERFSNRSVAGRTGRGDTAFAAYLARRMEAGVAESLEFAAALVSIKMETPGPFCGTTRGVMERIRQNRMQSGKLHHRASATGDGAEVKRTGEQPTAEGMA